MKKLIIALVITLIASVSYAGDLPVGDPTLSLEGNDVHLKVTLKETTNISQVKVLFQGTSGGLTENTTLQPYYDWYVGNDNNKTTLTDMYKDGWVLKQIIPYNAMAAKQFYIVLIK